MNWETAEFAGEFRGGILTERGAIVSEKYELTRGSVVCGRNYDVNPVESSFNNLPLDLIIHSGKINKEEIS